ncbi:MAG: flagellar export chaperone FliS [Defluviitaleaceae bacterium]|nr:flagellar export chaperone FliS [Defluviitaleaceae bacterium]
MIKPNPYTKMQDDAIMSASKEELTLMLYEGGIKFCNQALAALEKKDIPKANDLILRVQDIVREFQITLNHDYPIARQFDNLYDYMHRKLVEANFRKDAVVLNEVLGMFRSFRDTWKEAMKLARTGAAANVS